MTSDSPTPASPTGAPKRLRLSIWLALVLAFGGLTIATAVVVGISFYVKALENALGLAVEIGDAELSRIKLSVDTQLQPAADQSRFLADYISRGGVAPDDVERLQDVLLGSVGAVRQLYGVGYLGEDMKMVRAAAVSGGRSYATDVIDVASNLQLKDALETARDERVPFWAGPLTLGDGTPVLVAVSPVLRERRVIGVVTAAVSLRSAAARLAAASSSTDRVAFVATLDGHIVMHASGGSAPQVSRPAEDAMALPASTDFPDPVLRAVEKWPIEADPDTDALTRARNLHVKDVSVAGTDYLIVYRRIGGYGPEDWIIGYHESLSWIDEVTDTINSALPYAGGMVVIALLIAVWLGRAITRPMTVLSQAGQRLARLDFAPLEIGASRIKEVERAVEAQRAMRNGLQWLSNYIPRSLTPLLMQSGDVLASRERDVVVLFTDIVGFSTIAEGRRAGSVAALLNRHFGLLGAIIEEEGGTIDKYIGDSVMAFWGAPLDQEDRADRAVRAARRIARKLHADNERRARKGLKAIRIRIGLHKGPALVGNIGAPGRVNYTLVGDTVNLAQRLEQFGREIDDGTADAIVVISGELARELPADVPLLDRGEQVFAGRSAACHVFQVLVD